MDVVRVSATFGCAVWLGSATAAPNDGSLFVQVRPVLVEHCLSCHGGKPKKSSGFDLSTRQGLLRGGDRGFVIEPGHGKQSVLYKLVTHQQEPHMPDLEDRLPDAALALLARWIDAGAPYDEPLMKTGLGPIAASASVQHWAFEAPRRPALPSVKDPRWVKNPIDAFVAAGRERHGLAPLPPADRRSLLRRVYLDLIGLPPTHEAVDGFLADASPQAYEKVVDRLLASPQYAERWSRHWMDVWRYSDPYPMKENSLMRDNSAPYIWRWREWIVESLRDDKGYDQMIREMLAGDEVAPADAQVARATGYLARSWFRFNRHVWLTNVVDHTAFAFLGLTLKCARCHDHKYDPFSQEDYYRFRAFFEPYDVRIEEVPGEPNVTRDGLARAFDTEPREAVSHPQAAILCAIYGKTQLLVRGNENNPDTGRVITPGVPAVLGGKALAIKPISLPLQAYYPSIRSFVTQDLVAVAKKEVERAEGRLASAEAALTATRSRARRTSREDRKHQVDPSAQNWLAELAFEKEIKPIFEAHCLDCHAAGARKSGLVLETFEGLLEGGDKSGPAVIPGKGLTSPIVEYLSGKKKPRMPAQAGPLSPADMARITKWIDALPLPGPEEALRRVEGAVALADKRLATSRRQLAAVEARIAADSAKFLEPSSGTDHAALAEAARTAELKASVAEGEERLLLAQQRLAEALRLPPAADTAADKIRPAKIARARAAREELEAAGKALSKTLERYTNLGPIYPKTSTGRRLALAEWIASRENPLTSRVAINHIWMRHFGKPLVETITNFGRAGKRPTHPELLDWLAIELVEKNWSMKAIHRLMVTSNTYRMQSSPAEPSHPNLALDPENRFLWRMNARRMEAEAVRDSLLSIGGTLDDARGHAPVRATADHEDGTTTRMRSMYYASTPDTQMQFLKMFDAANPEDCYDRQASVIPQQALALANSKLGFTVARALAKTILQVAPRREAFIAEVFDRVLGRPPSAGELADCQTFLDEQADLLRNPLQLTAFGAGKNAELAPSTDPAQRARESLVHVLLNHNEFLTIR